MQNSVEASGDIRIQDILGFVVDGGKDGFNRIVTDPSRSKAVAVNPEQRSHPLYSASKPCVLISPHTAPQ